MVMSSHSYGSYWYNADQVHVDTGPERQTGRKAQTANIMAAKVSMEVS